MQRHAQVGKLAEAMTGYITWLIGQDKKAFRNRQFELRNELANANSHTRLPENAASLLLGIEMFLRFAVESEAITNEERVAYWTQAQTAIAEIGAEQNEHLAAEKHAERFLALLASVLASGSGHVLNRKTLNLPPNPEMWGWRSTVMGTNGRLTVGGRVGSLARSSSISIMAGRKFSQR